MHLTCIIVDDEYRARKALRNLCEKYIPGLEVVGEAAGVKEALEAIRQHKPDLVFLDIQMPGKSGLSLLEENVLPDLKVIFTTAHEQHAIQALRLKAQDYLLKPIGVSDLEAAIERLRAIREEKASEKNPPLETRKNALKVEKPTVLLATDEGMLVIALDKVINCEAVGAYTVFFLQDGRQVAVTRNLKQFEDQFEPHGFYRIHHKHLVNLEKLTEINARNNFVRMSNEKELPISQRKKAPFLKHLKEVFGG